MNKYITAARIVKDIELTNAKGTDIAKFPIAVDNPFKKDDTSFFDCVAFGKEALFISKYFSKGKQILIDGRLHQDRWETTAGEKRSRVVININKAHFMGSKSDNENSVPITETPAAPTDGFFPIEDEDDSGLPF